MATLETAPSGHTRRHQSGRSHRYEVRYASCASCANLDFLLWLLKDFPDFYVLFSFITREKEKFKQREIQFQSILQSKTNEITELTKVSTSSFL